MSQKFVLVDFENTCPEGLANLDADIYSLLLFVGAKQTKVPFETALLMQRWGNRAEYVKVSASGENALDFHIAFYIGHLVAAAPEAQFFVVSRDTGFDPLMTHLQSRSIQARRISEVCEIHRELTAPREPTSTREPVMACETTRDRARLVTEWLRKRKGSLPASLKTLTSSIDALFQRKLSPADLQAVVDALVRSKVVAMEKDKKKLRYAL